MRYQDYLPYKLIEKETGDIEIIEELWQLGMRLDEFFDQWDEDFELYNKDGKKIEMTKEVSDSITEEILELRKIKKNLENEESKRRWQKIKNTLFFWKNK
ncbi:MAG: hypothetical protein AABY53_01865 [Bdellovibrionota bacterium]